MQQSLTSHLQFDLVIQNLKCSKQEEQLARPKMVHIIQTRLLVFLSMPTFKDLSRTFHRLVEYLCDLQKAKESIRADFHCAALTV